MAGGNSVNNIAKWDGNSWTALGAAVNGSVYALLVLGGDLYAGGGFNVAGVSNANAVAKWNGTSWSGLGSGVNQAV